MLTATAFIAGVVAGLVGACGLVAWLAPELLEVTEGGRTVLKSSRSPVESAWRP